MLIPAEFRGAEFQGHLHQPLKNQEEDWAIALTMAVRARGSAR